jgi:hypothetical protein
LRFDFDKLFGRPQFSTATHFLPPTGSIIALPARAISTKNKRLLLAMFTTIHHHDRGAGRGQQDSDEL